MSVGVVNKTTGERIQTAGNPLDKVGDLTNLTTTAKDNAVAAINEVNAGLAGKQNTLTFDDAPTDGSNNPVKSNGIYDALAGKQNVTDNSLDTDAKTIVGAINEHEGDVATLKSGFTNLDNEVNGDSTAYPYADVITIPDAIPANLADCSVKIEPDQNLHGYANPWVGGAYKNKAKPFVRDSYGTKVEFDEPTGTITASGASNESGIGAGVIWEGTLPAGTYILSGNGFDSNLKVYKNWDWLADVTSSGVTFTISSDAIIRVGKYLSIGTTLSYNITEFMIRLSTEQDATFAPYTNICPISGHTEASVEVTDGDETTKTYTIALGDTIYGGTVDFDSGVMTVTMAQIASYDGETIGEPWISDRDVYAEGTTPTTGAQVVYTLAEPTTIQLAHHQIQLLKGQNTLTASTGQISVTVNGVSGSIGSVQEQVNEIAEDVADIATAVATKADYRKYSINANTSSYTISDLSDIFMSLLAVTIPPGYSDALNGLYVLYRQGNTLSLIPLHETTPPLGLTATLTDGNIVLAWTATNNFGGSIVLIDLYKIQ